MVQFLDMEKPSDLRIAIEELEGEVTALNIEDRFCWDHGYHVGPRCPRCGPHNGEARISRGRLGHDNLTEWRARKETQHG